jgi:hypothetical protein
MLEGTSQPTEELQRRHVVEAPVIDGAARRPYWFKLTRFAQLLGQDKITDAAYETGCCWRADYERVCTLTMPQPALDRIPAKGGAGWEPPQSILDAERRLRHARAIVTPAWERLLIDVLVEDRSWRSLGKLYRRKPDVMQETFIKLISALEMVYAHRRQTCHSS